MTIDDRPHLVLAQNHPAQHFVEGFRHAAQSNRARVSVLYWTSNEGGQFDEGFGRTVRWDVDLLSGYPWKQAAGANTLGRAFAFTRSLRRLDPDAVVCWGWATAAARLTIIWCLLTRTPLIFYGDTTWQFSSSSLDGIRARLRSLCLRTAFRFAAGALSTGTFNREFYIHLGMRPDHVVDGVYPVDVTSYAAARNSRLGDDGRAITIGFAGKLIPRKGVDELLRALALISDDRRWHARIVGDGPERRRLEALSRSLGIADRVDFVGFRNVSEMPSELAVCDIVVVPSTLDLRVCIAAEAMAAGAAVIVSSNTAVWGRGDLIEDGVTGRVYRSGEEGELSTILMELLENPVARAALQSAGAERATGQGADAFVAGLERVALTLVHGRMVARTAPDVPHGAIPQPKRGTPRRRP